MNTAPVTFNLIPSNLAEAMEYAKLIANSSLVPKDFRGKAGDVMIAVQMGIELGLPPLQALQNIAVINGRPCLWGDAMLAVVRAHSELEYIKEYDENDTAICKIKRKDEPEHTATFSQQDALLAGLANKPGPWKQYPKRMRQMRARAFAIRDTFPDALKGIHMAEEAQDIQPIKDITSTPTPSDKAQTIVATLTESPTNTPPSLEELINQYPIPAEIIDKWLQAAKVTHISELSVEQTNHCIAWIQNKYST